MSSGKMSPRLRAGLETFERAAADGLALGRKDLIRQQLDELMAEIAPVLLTMEQEVQDEILTRLGEIRVLAREDGGD